MSIHQNTNSPLSYVDKTVRAKSANPNDTHRNMSLYKERRNAEGLTDQISSVQYFLFEYRLKSAECVSSRDVYSRVSMTSLFYSYLKQTTLLKSEVAKP